MVGSGERLCFEGAPVVDPPLAQDPAKRLPYAFEGATIRSDQAVPRLTEYERHCVSDAKAKSAKALGRSAAEVQNKHDKKLAERSRLNSAQTTRPHFGKSEHAIAGCFTLMSSWSSIILVS